MKKIVFILVLLFVGFIGFAQIEFEENIVSLSLQNQNILVADIDNDGDLDIVSVDTNKIVWYKNVNGENVFSTPILINNLGNRPHFIDVADLDNDGDLDIVSASNIDNVISWYENIDGLGTFGVIQTISNFDSPNYIKTVDIDGDNDKDLLITSYYHDKVVWFENIDGLGTFGSEQIIYLHSEEQGSPVVIENDMDDDGDLDLILLSYQERKIVWLENIDGQGSFSIEHIIIDDTYMPFSSLALIDINNDGYLDILFENYNQKIVWLENIDGNGNFGSIQLIIQLSGSNLDFVSQDVDNDGDLDIIYSLDSTTAWIENMGNSTFGNEHIISNESGFSKLIVDIDGDNDNDFLYGSSQEIKWFDNVSNLNTFIERQSIGSSSYKPQAIETADIDGDGDMDVVIASENDDEISWYKNIDGNGTYDVQRIISTDVNGANTIKLSDIDGDGDVDVFTSSKFNDELIWFENTDGLGYFNGIKHIISTNIDNPTAIFAKDIDGDNDIDLVSASENDDQIIWFENSNGLGLFVERQVISNNAYGQISLFVEDIDGDNYMDVISSSYFDDKIVWYKNLDGQGSFSSELIITNDNDKVSSIFADDVDSDGDIDIISVSKGFSGKIYWFENLDGVGTFGWRRLISNKSNISSNVISSDIDNDGDKDVICATSYSGNDELIVFENINGFDSTSENIIYSYSFIGVNSITTSDINGNGKLDIISSFENLSDIYWFANLGLTSNRIHGFVNKTSIGSNNCDNDYLALSDILVTSDNGSESISTFTSNQGHYQLQPNSGTYLTSITYNLPNYYISNPQSYTNTFSEVGNVINADFCIEPIANIEDLNVSIIPKSQANPGFDASYQIVYKNVGTTQLSGDINLVYDNTKLAFLTANETIVSQTANNILFNYTNLNPFETKTIILDFNVLDPPVVNIGDVLDFTATINPVASDETPEDNVYEFIQTVVDSYSQNDISVAEGEQILLADADKFLHYIIRFQNTGTAHAVRVRVHNILDDKLDWTTLQLESSSHNNTVEIKNGSEIDFIFNAIYLPDSTTDEPNSHGYIAYKIKPKDNVSVGDVFVNNAAIYFDYNLAINTNTVTTEIVNTLLLNDNRLLNFTVYPVPTSDILKINTKSQISKIEIYNKLGQLVLDENNKNDINISNLNQGIYFIKITDINNNSNTKKIVKK